MNRDKVEEGLDKINELVNAVYEQINAINYAAHEINQKFISGNSVPVTQAVVKDFEWQPIMDAIQRIREIS